MAHHPTLYMHGIREKQLLFGDAHTKGRGSLLMASISKLV